MFTQPHLNTRRVGKIQDTQLQTRDIVEGLHNFQEFAHHLPPPHPECSDAAMLKHRKN